jgi:hypothetical protein
MGDLELDPAIAKLLEYAKAKKTISFDELSDFLPEEMLNSDKIDGVLALLESNNIQLEEEDLQLEEAVETKGQESSTSQEKKRLVYNDKESAVDDPIRLYLREIGKENLLTAEQEVELSKQMEEGENIIKRIIKKSGMLIPEFHQICPQGKKGIRFPAAQGELGTNSRKKTPQPVLPGCAPRYPGRSKILYGEQETHCIPWRGCKSRRITHDFKGYPPGKIGSR